MLKVLAQFLCKQLLVLLFRKYLHTASISQSQELLLLEKKAFLSKENRDLSRGTKRKRFFLLSPSHFWLTFPYVSVFRKTFNFAGLTYLDRTRYGLSLLTENCLKKNPSQIFWNVWIEFAVLEVSSDHFVRCKNLCYFDCLWNSRMDKRRATLVFQWEYA